MQSKQYIVDSKQDRALSVDPGFDRVGVAILSGGSSKQELLYSECIVTDRKDSHAERLLTVGNRIKKIIKEWQPTALGIEKLFFNQNTKSALGVAEARGVIIYEAVSLGLQIFEYSPQEIKIATTGYGKASKDDVKKMVLKLIKLSKMPKYDDEMDAIAVGITHLASHEQKTRLSPQK
ncbi:crossover junction endodeoxyribonuclease RuvC [soil metagenome]